MCIVGGVGGVGVDNCRAEAKEHLGHGCESGLQQSMSIDCCPLTVLQSRPPGPGAEGFPDASSVSIASEPGDIGASSSA